MRQDFFSLVQSLADLYLSLDETDLSSAAFSKSIMTVAALQRQLNAIPAPTPAAMKWRLQALRVSLTATPEHTDWQLETVDSLIRDVGALRVQDAN